MMIDKNQQGRHPPAAFLWVLLTQVPYENYGPEPPRISRRVPRSRLQAWTLPSRLRLAHSLTELQSPKGGGSDIMATSMKARGYSKWPTMTGTRGLAFIKWYKDGHRVNLGDLVNATDLCLMGKETSFINKRMSGVPGNIIGRAPRYMGFSTIRVGGPEE